MLRKSHVKGRSRTLVFLALMMSVLLVLAACGGQQAEAPASEPAAAEEVLPSRQRPRPRKRLRRKPLPSRRRPRQRKKLLPSLPKSRLRRQLTKKPLPNRPKSRLRRPPMKKAPPILIRWPTIRMLLRLSWPPLWPPHRPAV